MISDEQKNVKNAIEYIDELLDSKKRQMKFNESLQFLQKIIITDDGDLVSQSRVLIPETMLITDFKGHYKKKKQDEEYQQTNSDNGIEIHVT